MSDTHAAAPPAELPRFTSSTAAMGAAAVLGVVGLGLTFVLADGDRGWQSYLLGVVYWLSASVGSMMMLLFFHAAAAKWVTAFRRVMEALASGVWLQAVLVLPILFLGIPHIYKWAKPGYVYGEPGSMTVFKEWWLNVGHFQGRVIFELAVFCATVWFLNAWSKQQDNSNDPRWHDRLVRLGSGGVPVVGLVATAMAFDLVMSLDPDWGSTVYGAYLLAGSYMCAMGFTALLTHQRRQGVLQGVAGTFEFHNLGKMLFMSVCFWAYLGYAQYMLMWIANLPEEVAWWIRRFEGEWRSVFWMLILGHFIAPFFMLLRKVFKLNSGWMKIVAVYIMAMHFVDVSFLILPSDSVHGLFQLSDLAAVVGAGGLHLAFVMWRMNGVVVAPRGDPNFGAPIAVH